MGDASSEPVVKVPAVSSKRYNGLARGPPNTDPWILPSDMDLSRVSLRTSSTIPVVVHHSPVCNSRILINSVKIMHFLLPQKVPQPVKQFTAERRQPFTSETSSQSDKCQKEPHAVVLK